MTGVQGTNDMNMKKTNAGRAIAMSVAAALLAACSTHVSRDISAEGVAGEVIFPDADSATMKEGTFPNPGSLALVKPGITKDQLYYLLGRPHFREGFHGVREWDYLFHFRVGDAVRTCQYKVIFDREYHGRSFHWLPEDCASVLAPPLAAVAPPPPALPPPPVPPAAPPPRSYSLGGDALFAFGGAGLDALSADGRASLARIADELKAAGSTSVDVFAYTDRIGSEAANLRLSQARANTIRDYLVSHGMPAAGIRAVGMGEAAPVATCDDALPRAELIACLAPNRRVEIRASAVR